MPAWADIDTIVFHYPAGNTPDGDPTDTGDVAGYLRATQTAYERDRGYSIGYSFAFDHRGDVWQLRGWDIKPAATQDHNGHTIAFLLIVDQDAPAGPAMVEAVRGYVAEAERRAGRTLAIRGHGEFAATGCPGAGVRAQIAAGTFRPITPTPEDHMPSTARRVTLKGTLSQFLIGAGPPLHLTPELAATYADVPLLEPIPFHHQFAVVLYHQTGLTPDQLAGTWVR
jgi:hypothetical protein